MRTPHDSAHHTTDVGGLLPDANGQLVVQPVLEMSVAAQVSTIVRINSTTYRVPVVTADPSAAFFGTTTTNGPAGLGSLTTSTTVGAFTSTDPFAEAISEAEQVGSSIDFFVTDPATALTLEKVRKAIGSNEPLLGADATQPGLRRILGVPLLVSSTVAAGVVWGIDSAFVQLVVRDATRLDVDQSAYFSSDRVGVRATMRVGIAVTHEMSVAKITAA